MKYFYALLFFCAQSLCWSQSADPKTQVKTSPVAAEKKRVQDLLLERLKPLYDLDAYEQLEHMDEAFLASDVQANVAVIEKQYMVGVLYNPALETKKYSSQYNTIYKYTRSLKYQKNKSKYTGFASIDLTANILASDQIKLKYTSHEDGTLANKLNKPFQGRLNLQINQNLLANTFKSASSAPLGEVYIQGLEHYHTLLKDNLGEAKDGTKQVRNVKAEATFQVKVADKWQLYPQILFNYLEDISKENRSKYQPRLVQSPNKDSYTVVWTANLGEGLVVEYEQKFNKTSNEQTLSDYDNLIYDWGCNQYDISEIDARADPNSPVEKYLLCKLDRYDIKEDHVPTAVKIFVGILPGPGWVISGSELYTGKDYWTNEKLANWQRGMALIDFIPLEGAIAKLGNIAVTVTIAGKAYKYSLPAMRALLSKSLKRTLKYTDEAASLAKAEGATEEVSAVLASNLGTLKPGKNQITAKIQDTEVTLEITVDNNKTITNVVVGKGVGSLVKSADELASFVAQHAIRSDINLDFVISMTQGRRDLIESILLSTKEVVEGKNLQQLFQYFNISNIPSANSLSNYQVRIWYKYTKGNIGNILDKTKTLEIKAKQAFDLRNTYRSGARNYMQDRKLAEYLQQNEVNQVWDAFIKRTEKKLIDQGKDVSNKDIIWNEIIDNSMHGREDVDKLFNLYDL